MCVHNTSDDRDAISTKIDGIKRRESINTRVLHDTYHTASSRARSDELLSVSFRGAKPRACEVPLNSSRETSSIILAVRARAREDPAFRDQNSIARTRGARERVYYGKFVLFPFRRCRIQFPTWRCRSPPSPPPPRSVASRAKRAEFRSMKYSHYRCAARCDEPRFIIFAGLTHARERELPPLASFVICVSSHRRFFCSRALN